jgi:hypothetical protein
VERRRRPYGYAADGITVIPDEAKAIAEATTALLAGASLRGIADEWNREGRHTSTGGEWHPHTLRAVVTRPRNAGLMEHRGEIIGKAEWAAIVPEVEWQALVDKLADPKRRSNSRGPNRKWLGSGLYRCECGVKLICSASNKGTKEYRCRDGCGQLSRRQADVDNYVSRVIVARLRKPDMASLLARDNAAEIAELEAEAVAFRARLDSLAAFFAQGAIDAQQLTEGTRQLNAQLTEVRGKTSKPFNGSALSGIADSEDAGSAWLEAPLDRQRAVIDALATVTLLSWAPEAAFRSDRLRFRAVWAWLWGPSDRQRQSLQRQPSESDVVHDHIRFSEHQIVAITGIAVGIGARHMKHAGTAGSREAVGGSPGGSQLSPGRGPTKMISHCRTDANCKVLVKRVGEHLLPTAQGWGLWPPGFPVATPGTGNRHIDLFSFSFPGQPSVTQLHDLIGGGGVSGRAAATHRDTGLAKLMATAVHGMPSSAPI